MLSSGRALLPGLGASSPDFRRRSSAGLDAPALDARSALAKLGRHDYAGALQDSLRSISIDPGLQSAWRTRYKAEYYLGNYQDVLVSARKALELGIEHEADWLFMAMAKLQLGQYEPALADCQESLRLNGLNSMLFSTRGLAHMHLGEYEAALDDFSHAIRLEPHDVRDWCNRARTSLLAGNGPGAVDDCTEAIRMNAVYIDAWVFRAAANNSVGDYVAGLRDANAALRLDQKCADAWSHRSESRLRLGEFAASIEDASTALSLNKDLASALTHRGEAEFNLQDYQGCIRDCQRALDLDPAKERAWLFHAKAKFQRGRFGEAANSATTALAQRLKKSSTDAEEVDPSLQLAAQTLEKSKLGVEQMRAWRIPKIIEHRAFLHKRRPPPKYDTAWGVAPRPAEAEVPLELPPLSPASLQASSPSKGKPTNSRRRAAKIEMPEGDPVKEVLMRLLGGASTPRSASTPELGRAASGFGGSR